MPLVPYRLWTMLAFSRIPGNAFSFWIRQTLKWSRGAPTLPHEPKENLFDYLGIANHELNNPQGAKPAGRNPLLENSGESPDARKEAERREGELRERYNLAPLRKASTRALYRKNLYLLDILEQACGGLDIPGAREAEPGSSTKATSSSKFEGQKIPRFLPSPLNAIDVGSQDWHYVFALERWLRYANAAQGRDVKLKGVEADGYGIYPDFRSRKDYAQAYGAQTGNSDITYEVGDFLKTTGNAADVLTWFYPFVTRHHLLLWGLPLRFYRPEKLLEKAAASLKPGGWMLVYTHTQNEHELFKELGKKARGFALVREGQARSRLVDFYKAVADRRFSLWKKE